MWTQICMPSQGKDSILPHVVIRKSVNVAKHIQIRILVGRSTQAKAASNRQRRSLFSESEILPIATQDQISNFVFSSTSLCSPFARKPSLSISSSSSASIDHCQGQKFSATTVRVVSRQLERVRVEQNHCQGLQTVRASYRIRDPSDQLMPQLIKMAVHSGTYSRPCFITAQPVDTLPKFPRVVIPQRGNYGLCCLWRRN